VNPEEPIVFAVDDDASMREALSRLFRSIGMRAQFFASAEEFLTCKRPDAPACLVLDVRLPGLSGLELQRELADLAIPIIFITGHGDIQMSVEAMKGGAVEFLTKPFRDQMLLDSIRQAIQRDSANRKRRAEIAELRARYDLLTQREREVLALVREGRSVFSQPQLSEAGLSCYQKVHELC
jgi:FixJ family two-component response regulator